MPATLKNAPCLRVSRVPERYGRCFFRSTALGDGGQLSAFFSGENSREGIKGTVKEQAQDETSGNPGRKADVCLSIPQRCIFMHAVR